MMTLKEMQKKWKPRGWWLRLITWKGSYHKSLYANKGGLAAGPLKMLTISGVPRPQVYDIMDAALEQMPEGVGHD